MSFDLRREESIYDTFNENKRFIFMNKQFYNNKKYKKEFQLITKFQSYIYLIKNCQLTKYLYYLIFVIIIMISLILFNKIYNSSRRNESKTLFNTKYLVQNYTKLSTENDSSINNNLFLFIFILFNFILLIYSLK
jgi:hypothetical protein